jgi:hypothetical protein
MRTLGLYFVLLLVLAGLFWLQQFVSTRPFAEPETSSLTKLQEKQLDIFRDSNTLLTTLATAAIAGVGAFVFNRYTGKALPTGQRIRAFLSALLSCSSLYFGYLAHETVTWMLQQGFFNIMSSRIVWAQRLQFWSFLVSLLFLADFFYSGLSAPEVVP